MTTPWPVVPARCWSGSGGLSIPRNVVVDADELLGEKEKYKTISEDLDFTFTELAGF